MQKSDSIRNTLLYLFLSSAALSAALYLYLFLFRKSGATELRSFFTLLSISAGSLIFYFCSGLYTTRFRLFGILGLLFAANTLLICLFAIWADASFLSSRWLLIEICIALSVAFALGSFILKKMGK